MYYIKYCVVCLQVEQCYIKTKIKGKGDLHQNHSKLSLQGARINGFASYGKSDKLRQWCPKNQIPYGGTGGVKRQSHKWFM